MVVEVVVGGEQRGVALAAEVEPRQVGGAGVAGERQRAAVAAVEHRDRGAQRPAPVAPAGEVGEGAVRGVVEEGVEAEVDVEVVAALALEHRGVEGARQLVGHRQAAGVGAAADLAVDLAHEGDQPGLAAGLDVVALVETHATLVGEAEAQRVAAVEPHPPAALDRAAVEPQLRPLVGHLEHRRVAHWLEVGEGAALLEHLPGVLRRAHVGRLGAPEPHVLVVLGGERQVVERRAGDLQRALAGGERGRRRRLAQEQPPGPRRGGVGRQPLVVVAGVDAQQAPAAAAAGQLLALDDERPAVVRRPGGEVVLEVAVGEEVGLGLGEPARLDRLARAVVDQLALGDQPVDLARVAHRHVDAAAVVARAEEGDEEERQRDERARQEQVARPHPAA
ncbi:MAG TPA: hypothetical protein VHM02_13735, partial [Thermoanaerobaculia bacterium]|nr:hypothetical protein [Thermoanaerobaculia bacterium]